MDPLIYEYLFTGLTLILWLSPLILLVVVSATIYLSKKRGPSRHNATLSEENPKRLPMQQVS